MAGTIDMQDMRYLNLFNKITRVQTHFCFKYNEGIVFCVRKSEVSKAIGRDGQNIKKLGQILRKKVKVVFYPEGEEDAKKFIESVVSPVAFKEIQITPEEIVIVAGSVPVKATLMGRNKKRLEEISLVVKNYFQRELRII